jgi:hypothetical protein
MGIFQSIFGNRNRKTPEDNFTVTITKEYIKVNILKENRRSFME